jgi:2-C-methyl-D-erythritol 4-phosphate cytidylyltransferase
MLTAIIVAAGSSSRMGFDKLIAPLLDKPVIEHAVDAFDATGSVTDIIVVTRADRVSEFEGLLRGKTKLRQVIAGGEHRQDSVNAGLQSVGSDAQFIAVHDAARPLVTPEQIESVFRQARKSGSASLADPVTDTLKRVDPELYVTESIDRQQVYAMETPQIFAREILEEAYRLVFAKKMQITDEVSAVEMLGRKVVLVSNGDFNFKITFERDLPIADFILRERRERAGGSR